MVSSRAADIALGFRAIADAFNLGFVPITSLRCDVVIPDDMLDHPIVMIILDVINSKVFQVELGTLPGYESFDTGNVIEVL